MTVSTTISRVIYSPSGAETAFPVPFVFFGEGDLEVIERLIATGAETVKVLGADYTVSGGAGTTGTVTAVAPPPATVQWVIRRATPLTQDIDYVENDPFPAATHEEGLDRAVIRLQEQKEELVRTPKFPISDPASSIGDLPNSVARAGKALTFGEDGKPTATAFGVLSTDFDITLAPGDAGKAVVVNGTEDGLDLGAVPAPAARVLTAGAGLTGGGDLSADRAFALDIASQAEAEAGASNAKAMTPLRTAEAIAARGGYLLYQEQRSSGTFSPTYSAGAWRTAALNTEVVDTDNHGSLATNQVTLDAGTYEFIGSVSARVSASLNGTHRARLYNITDGTTVAQGNQVGTLANVVVPAVVTGRFTIAASKVFELQIYTNQTTASVGVMSTGDSEIYTTLEFRKVA